MKWTEEQRAERAARLLSSAAIVATEAARLCRETVRYAHVSLAANQLAARLRLISERLSNERFQADPQLRFNSGAETTFRDDPTSD